MLEFSKLDLARLETVMKALKRGKYELEGDEVLAFAQAFAYLSSLYEKIKTDNENTLRNHIATPIEVKPTKKAKK